MNRRLDRAAAEAIAEIFTEVVIAPDADEDAIAVFAKKKNLRLLVTGGLPDPATPGLYAENGRRRLPGAEPRQRPHHARPI